MALVLSTKPWGTITEADYADAGDYCDAEGEPALDRDPDEVGEARLGIGVSGDDEAPAGRSRAPTGGIPPVACLGSVLDVRFLDRSSLPAGPAAFGRAARQAGLSR